MSLRRRLRELEQRVAALEGGPSVDYSMPPRHDIASEPVEAHSLWRERCVDYGAVIMVDVEDDRAVRRHGVYL